MGEHPDRAESVDPTAALSERLKSRIHAELYRELFGGVASQHPLLSKGLPAGSRASVCRNSGHAAGETAKGHPKICAAVDSVHRFPRVRRWNLQCSSRFHANNWRCLCGSRGCQQCRAILHGQCPGTKQIANALQRGTREPETGFPSTGPCSQLSSKRISLRSVACRNLPCALRAAR
jgi:hypothetical protein